MNIHQETENKAVIYSLICTYAQNSRQLNVVHICVKAESRSCLVLKQPFILSANIKQTIRFGSVFLLTLFRLVSFSCCCIEHLSCIQVLTQHCHLLVQNTLGLLCTHMCGGQKSRVSELQLICHVSRCFQLL